MLAATNTSTIWAMTPAQQGGQCQRYAGKDNGAMLAVVGFLVIFQERYKK
jgi:hypothetical protein